MYFIELRYTNGKSVKLPNPFVLYQDAYREVLNNYASNPYYTAVIVND